MSDQEVERIKDEHFDAISESEVWMIVRQGDRFQIQHWVSKWPTVQKIIYVLLVLFGVCREKRCRAQFSLSTGTIMEATHLRADQWCIAVWMLINCRNGVSSCEIARTVGCKQQSAWHLLHRARALLTPDVQQERFHGTCETDWTYVGGLMHFMSHERRERARARGNKGGKAIVNAIKHRKSGKVRAVVIPFARSKHIRREVCKHITRGSHLYTDESPVHDWMQESWFVHKSVNHKHRYVDGKVHTNGCENFFNNLRRALKGTYIKPAPEHLGAYVDEAVFRFNIRGESEWARFDAAMRRMVGKRLTYADLTDGATR